MVETLEYAFFLPLLRCASGFDADASFLALTENEIVIVLRNESLY